MRTILLALALALAADVAPAREATRGPVTDLPMPRFVSMKASEGNARRGPSRAHRIDWVFTRRHMPLLLVDEYGQWRRVVDREGAGGWMHHALLSGSRTVIVEGEEVTLRRRPDADAPPTARLQGGVVAWLEGCGPEWCDVEVGAVEGWAAKAALWGVFEDELLD